MAEIHLRVPIPVHAGRDDGSEVPSPVLYVDSVARRSVARVLRNASMIASSHGAVADLAGYPGFWLEVFHAAEAANAVPAPTELRVLRAEAYEFGPRVVRFPQYELQLVGASLETVAGLDLASHLDEEMNANYPINPLNRTLVVTLSRRFVSVPYENVVAIEDDNEGPTAVDTSGRPSVSALWPGKGWLHQGERA